MEYKYQPIRQCIGCKQCKVKKELIKIVCNSKGEIHLDKTGHSGGRGAYICRSPECVRKAWKSRALDRAYRVRVDNSTYDEIKSQMEELWISF